MANNNKASVFVGNIPFEQTEEQIIKICEEIGPVVSFKLMIDRDTGRPKGYGFCQYRDEETALSACRNLNGRDIDGRPLRVGPSNATKGGSAVAAAAAPTPVNYGGLGFVSVPQQQPAAPPVSYGGPGFLGVPRQQPMGVPCYVPAPFCSYVDPMADHLETRYTKNQLTEVLSQFQILARQNTDLARQLLSTYPALSSAVYQGLGLLDMAGNQVRM